MATNQEFNVLVCDPLDDLGLNILREHTTVDIKLNVEEEDLVDIIDKYDAVIVRNRTNLTRRVIESAGKLKVIARAGSGLNNIDVNAAKERGIQVLNTPNSNTVAVAEMVLGMMLSFSRRIVEADISMKAGRWEKEELIGSNLQGKTLGIIGFGRIGRQVALRAKAFGMKIIVNQHRPTPELNLQFEVEHVDLVELLKSADFVTIHLPLNSETENLIGEKEIGYMKGSAVLINTARAGIIDYGVLRQALENKAIAGAAIDVYPTEPAQDYSIASLSNVVATPHIAASSIEANRAVSVDIAEQIVDVLNASQPTSILPLAVVPMASIMPHESIDQKRVDRLKSRLDSEGILANPPIVTSLEDKFMVLDGATRTAALRQLGYPHAVVQISNEEDGLALTTWFHAIQQIERDALIALLDGIESISLEKTDPEKAAEHIFEFGALCYIKFRDGETYLIHAESGQNRLEALNQLTETYIDATYVDRTLETDLTLLISEYPDLSALVVFPEYTVSQVRQVTLSGRYFPAGITRFIIPGRILRVNADLKILKSKEMTLNEKNRWLNKHLEAKIQGNHVRFYRESVFLLDE